MKKKHELSNSDSCLNRSHPDEPVFVLRGNDESAPAAVRSWVQRYCKDRGGSSAYAGLTVRQKAKVDEASSVARDMEEWKSKHKNGPPPIKPVNPRPGEFDPD